MRTIFKKGISIPIMISGVGLIASLFVGYFGGIIGQNEKLADTKQEIAIVKTTEDLHYKEIQKILERIEKKLDTITPVANTYNKVNGFTTKK